jgi:hypothetical protein
VVEVDEVVAVLVLEEDVVVVAAGVQRVEETTVVPYPSVLAQETTGPQAPQVALIA